MTLPLDQSMRAFRMMDSCGEEAAGQALAALVRDAAAFAPGTATAAQRSLIHSEIETIVRRLASAETEAGRERAETEALAAERAQYVRAAEALAEQASATAEDLRDIGRAIVTAERIIVAQSAADARTSDWLSAVRAEVEGLADALAGLSDSASAAASPPVLRSLSRIGAMLGAMLREAEERRDRAQEAMTAAQALPFAGFARNPIVAAAVARAATDEKKGPGRGTGDG